MGIDTVSVLTIVRNREAHLANVLRGLIKSIRQPDEFVVVRMNETAKALSDIPFSCKQIELNSESHLPLSIARNAAVKEATGDLLIFLDVDCIPGKYCISEYIKAYNQLSTAVYMGGVFYLKHLLASAWTEQDLRQQSSPHHLRDPNLQVYLQPEHNYNLFWTLSFAMGRLQFDQLGGFCEDYQGYGAEDTDFARLMEQRGMELRWVPTAPVYHQYHHSQVPPYQHLDSIVHNAQVYYRRWQRWPMESWLAVFADEGLIDWSPEASAIRQL